MFYFFKRMSFILLSLLTLNACSSGVSALDNTQTVDDEKEAIVIMKIVPRNMMKSSTEMAFIRNMINAKEDSVNYNPLSFDEYLRSVIEPKNGYFVFKTDLLPSHMTNVVDWVREVDSTTGEETIALNNDCGGYSYTFSIQEPGVYYLGDITYWEETSEIGELKNVINVEYNTDEAIQFLNNNHPAINTDSLKTKEFKTYWRKDRCQPAVIYI